MSEKTIKIARYRNTPYTVNFTTVGGMKTYTWAGSKGSKIDIKQVPSEVAEWLNLNSVCFKDGELVIVDDSNDAKEIIENIDDKESYKQNAHSKEEIEKLLQGNINKMKKELAAITVASEKRFVIDVAKEKGLDSKSKLDWLAEWIGVPTDLLFEQ